MYTPPSIESGRGAAKKLREVKGVVLVTTMEPPWELLQRHCPWEPAHVHMVTDMDLVTLEGLNASLPPCDVVVGVGGGSCVDSAKFLAWKRACPMVLVPTIISVDAALTNMVAVRVDDTVQYVGDRYPERLIVDHDLIQQAPKILNQAGAADIASIHTALLDWSLSHEHTGEAYHPDVAALARECLAELDAKAAEIHNVTPAGIDTVIDLFRREVEFCDGIGTSRPEEGSEHLVAYNMEHITRRHFIHGDLVALGIFMMTRLQQNGHDWAVDLMDRLGLRYRCPDATRDQVRECLRKLRTFREENNYFFSIIDTEVISEEFVDDAIRIWRP